MRELPDRIIRPGGLSLTDRALAYCNLPPGASVLDVGCGQAASVAHLIAHYQLTAVGIDPSALLLQSARCQNARLPLVQSYGETLPVRCNWIDALLAECSLSAMQDMNRALTEFWRVLRPGGYLILSDIYIRNLDGKAALHQLPISSCLSGAVSQQEVMVCVQSRGFTVLLWEDHTHILKSFAAQLIWVEGSIQQFWCRAASCKDSTNILTAITQSRPGYYLLIAQKQELDDERA
ncbi:MAG: class I SAM-dependent methyltransferase [Anaerolineae bacterium]|nr:class I SAM-dependent methyltransferase [Anaerolineae bacterium]